MNAPRASGLAVRVRRSRADHGFTLIEVIFAIVLSSMIISVVAAGLITALNVSRSTTAQVADSNDAGLISSFLVRDAQSAGGIDPSSALPDQTLGVATNASDADGTACISSGGGDGSKMKVRFSWIDRTAATATTPAKAIRNVVAYALTATNLTRYLCTNGAYVVNVVLGRNISTAKATCLPTLCAGHPVAVSLALEGKGTGAPLNYTLTASLRTAASLVAIMLPSKLEDGQLGVPYASAVMTTIGAAGQTKWAVDILPAGLRIDEWTGMVYGTPTGTPTPSSPYPVTSDVTVTVTDGLLATVTRVYPITIHAPPIARDDAYSAIEDTRLSATIGVLANDYRREGNPVSPVIPTKATLASGVAHGTLVFSSQDGSFIYTPDLDYTGTDSFTYRANDPPYTSAGSTGPVALDSNAATVTLNVATVNDAPVNQVPVGQKTPMNTPLVFSSNPSNVISISDVDAGGTTVKVQLSATNGNINLSGTAGLTFGGGGATDNGKSSMSFTGTIADINKALNGLTFHPNSGYTGPATLQIITNDQGNTGSGGAMTDMDTVNITVSNDSLGDFTTNQDIGGTKKTGSCEYSDGTYTVSAGQGLVEGGSDNFQFCFRQLTGDGTLTAKVVSFDANGPGDAQAGVMFRETLDPDSTHAMVDLTGDGGEFLFRNGKGSTTTSVQNRSLRVPQWMRLTRVGNLFTAEWSSDGATWIPAGKQTIATALTVYVGLAVSAHANNVGSAQFDHVAISTTPTAANDSYSVNQYGTLTVPAVTGVLANDSDPASNSLTAKLVSGTAGLTLSPDGSFIYKPPATFSGTATFTYTANDGILISPPATVTITVNPRNPPNAVPSFTKGADQTIRANLGFQAIPGWATAISAGDTGQLVDFVVTNTNNSMFSVQPWISADGTLTYASAPADVLTGVGASGTATLSVFIHDNGGTANGGIDTSAVQTFTISIVSR